MKFRKFAIFMMSLLLCLAIVGCNKTKKKTFNITYELDGGVLPANAPTAYDDAEGVELVSPTKEDYKFLNWVDASNKKVTKIAKGTGKDVKLTAKWKQIVFKLTLDLNGGTYDKELPAKYDSTKDVTLPTPTLSGQVFTGWVTEDGVKVGTQIAADTFAEDLKLIANYRTAGQVETRTIQFDLAGGSFADGYVAPTEYEVGEGLPTLPTPTREGFEFAGWFDGEGNQVFAISKTDDQNFSLVARWLSASEKHSIKYNLDGGAFPEGFVAPTHFFESLGLVLPTNATKEGFVLKGWKMDGSDQLITEIAAGTNTDVTLVAQWDVPSVDIYYTITYKCEGGTLPEGIKTQYKYGEGYVLPDAIPSNEKERFLGWYQEIDGVLTSNKVTRISNVAAGNITLVASFGIPGVYEPKWELNQVGFQGNGMDFVIKVTPVTSYDPNDPGYTGDNVDVKKMHQDAIEAAYDITIVWSAWDDAAPWGPERVKFINKKYLNNEFGDVYVLTIASQWIPTLVKGGSIAELYDINADSGIFTELSYDEEEQDTPGYIQDTTTNDAASVKGKVYGYAPGVARPDYFMYYNVDLVKECNLEDPAEMWLKGEWTLSNFDAWVNQAQNILKNSKGYALDMGFAESIIGMVASTGNQMTKVNPPLLYLVQKKVTDTIATLQSYYQSGVYYGRGVQDVSPGFQAGQTLLHHGDLWFLKTSDRFNPSKMTFKIGVVPYPCADGEGGTPITSDKQEDGIKINDSEYLMYEGRYVTGVDMSNSSFQVPYTGTACYAVLNIAPTGAKNGITTKIITHILHDLVSGIGKDPNSKVTLTEDEAYRNFLQTKFDRDIDVEVVMSCQGKTYFELMELLSMTVGGGSHFGPDAFWPLAASIVKSKDSPTTSLQEVLEKYKSAMRELGYNIK